MMKWWGWGDEDETFDIFDRPHLEAYLRERLGCDLARRRPPVPIETIDLPPSRLGEDQRRALQRIVGREGVSVERFDRILHTYGKSYRDLFRLRQGIISRSPDAVIWPATEATIAALLEFCHREDVAVIPFGGGTSVVGGVEADPDEDRPILSLDMTRLADVLWIRPEALLAEVQAGIMGPALERYLALYHMTLGHFPQSFEFSTLGGWIATRSAGQASSAFGRIEENVVSLTMATPRGTLETLATPATATGPSLKELMIGSEGVFGVITRAVLRLHPRPAEVDLRALLFPSFRTGWEALRDLSQSELRPSVVRLSDEEETRTGMASQTAPATLRSMVAQRLGRRWLAWRGVDLEQCSLLLLAFEGNDRDELERRRTRAAALCGARGAVDLGPGPARSWWKERFHHPYLRDRLMDAAIMVETLETATTWERLPALYDAVRQALEEALAALAASSLVLCHVSHLYPTGASLYFTFLAPQAEGREMEQWERAKGAATEAIIAAGGTISHHHGVGRDHKRWLEVEIGGLGQETLANLRRSLDPKGILNPGCLLP